MCGIAWAVSEKVVPSPAMALEPWLRPLPPVLMRALAWEAKVDGDEPVFISMGLSLRVIGSFSTRTGVSIFSSGQTTPGCSLIGVGAVLDPKM